MIDSGHPTNGEAQVIQPSSKLGKLGDDRSFWLVTAWIVGTISFLKGVRFPNLWSATEAQFDYRFGFIKRGFFGTYISAPLHLEHYARFTAFSFLVLFCAICLLIVLTAGSGIRKRIGHGLPVALFFSSFVLAYLGNTNGYLEIFQLVITLVLLLFTQAWIRFVLAVPLCAVCLLIHEGFLFLLFPVLLFSFVIDAMVDSKQSKLPLLLAAVLFLVCVSLTYAIASRPSLSQAQVERLEAGIASRIDFGPLDTVRQELFVVLVRSSADNRAEMWQAWHHRLFQRRLIGSKLVFFPTVFLLLTLIAKCCINSRLPAVQNYGLAVSFIAVLTPLAMNAFGFDTARWDTYVCLNAFLCLLLIVRALPSLHLSLSPVFRNASLLAIMLSMATGELLLDVDHANSFPFLTPLHNLTEYLKHDRWIPPFQLH